MREQSVNNIANRGLVGMLNRVDAKTVPIVAMTADAITKMFKNHLEED